jgi:hypothetical protein
MAVDTWQETLDCKLANEKCIVTFSIIEQFGTRVLGLNLCPNKPKFGSERKCTCDKRAREINESLNQS